MMTQSFDETRQRLEARKEQLNERLERVKQNHRRPRDPDSKERATEAENDEVVDALGSEAFEELALIAEALNRLEAGTFGSCVECRREIDDDRLQVFPYAKQCIECANRSELAAAKSKPACYD